MGCEGVFLSWELLREREPAERILVKGGTDNCRVGEVDEVGVKEERCFLLPEIQRLRVQERGSEILAGLEIRVDASPCEDALVRYPTHNLFQ